MDSVELENRRRSISATLAEIEQLQKSLGLGPDPADREAFDIVSRIERKLAANAPAKKEPQRVEAESEKVV